MNLSNLQPAAGSVKNQGKRVGRGQGSGKVEPQHVVTKEQNLDLDIPKN